MSHSPESTSVGASDEKNVARAAIQASDMSDSRKQQAMNGMSGPPPFKISQLWQAPVLNPMNLKSYTLPILNLSTPYARNFHLSWLGFFVAFLAWFAFPPLIPEAIRADLHLTAAQVGNSNIVSLCATLLVRLIAGPLVDRFGPRKVMAGILIVGAIPSGLAGTVTTASGLYTIRFFIGILGGTFVPCQAWTTLFFDKSIVGRANALVGGWGNAGGGMTFIVMTNAFQSMVADRGWSPHSSWRAAFALVPVPILLGVAALTLIFGTDSPAGSWDQRHDIPATAVAAAKGHHVHLTKSEIVRKKDVEQGAVSVVAADEENEKHNNDDSDIDVAVNEALTVRTAIKVFTNPQTWLVALSYFTTFGLELAIDANFVNTLFAMYQSAPQRYTQVTCGYLTAVFGLMNFVTRPFGGYCGDLIYKRYGVPGKKWLLLTFASINGLLCLGLGIYISHNYHATAPVRKPSVGGVMGLTVVFAIFNEMSNGINFSLVPHLNAYNNGVMSGIVGAVGNLGGVVFAIVWRYVPTPQGKAYWISGIIVLALNASVVWVKVPKK